MEAISKGKKAPHVDLVPILDALTVVIFFLVLSVSFSEYVKLTVPPTQITDSPPSTNESTPPISPKLIVKEVGSLIHVGILWSGKTPGSFSEKIVKSSNLNSDQIYLTVESLTKKFKEKFPNENELQIGLTADLKFKQFITVTDAAKKSFKDIVMMSYEDAERETWTF